MQVHYHQLFTWKMPILLLLSIFLCGVTSGTLFSAIGALVITTLFEFERTTNHLSLKKSSLILILAAFGCVYFYLDFVLVGVVKNLIFFGGGYNGFLQLLKHGFGGVLYPFVNALSLEVLIALAILGAVCGSLVLRLFNYHFLLHIMFGAIAFGAFGFSTLTLAFMPVMVFLSLGLNRIRV